MTGVLSRLVVGVAAAVLVALAATHAFDKDEIEHVHAAWLIASGLQPYRDFFENHHPLLWYGLSALLPVLPESSAALIVLRLLLVLQVAGIAALTGVLARRTIDRPGVGWLAAALLLSMSAFDRNAYTIRPDVPQTLCVLAGAVCLTDPLRRASRAGVAGLLFGVALLFSLKALLAATVTGSLLLAWRQRRHIDTRFVLAFVLACTGPLALFATYLVATGAVRDYYVSNWTMNAVLTFGRWDGIAPSQALIVPDLLFWTLAIAGAVWLIVWRPRPDAWMAVVNGIGTTAIMIAISRWDSRSVMLAVPFLSVTGAAAIALLGDRLGTWRTAALTAAACGPPLLSVALMLPETGESQRARIDYVLEHTAAGEAVYDANALFNLFRPDLHYIWFHPTIWPHPRAPVWAARVRRIVAETLGRDTYDACTLVAAARPRIVSSITIDLAACGLADAYEPTPFEWTFLRK